MADRWSNNIGPRASGQQTVNPNWHTLVWIFAAMMLLFYGFEMVHHRGPQVLSYTQFKQDVRSGQVAEITIRGQQIRGRLKQGSGNSGKGSASGTGSGTAVTASKRASQSFETTVPSFGDSGLMALLEKNHVVVNARSTRPAWWETVLTELLPWLLIFGLIFYFSRQMQQRMSSSGGLFSFGRSKAKRFREERPRVGMDDVAGSDNAKGELEEIADFLKEPARYRSVGADIPRGVLMVGPPGTGKTLMAKAVAAQAGVPFFSTGGSEFIEMFVGVGASRVRDMFKEAKNEAPSIIFIDELDSIGRARGAGVGGGHDEREQTLNQILSEMDGFSDRESVIVLAATNRPDVLDPALMRPGRFDRQVYFELPHRQAREAILGIHSRNRPLTDDVDLASLAGRTVGFSGADLANLVNEAALLTARRKGKHITMDDFVQARDKLVLGARREEMLGEDEQKVIAFHESGHALMAALLPNADPLDKVTIIPRGRALGATEQVPEDRYNMNESYLGDRLAVMLGGRGAEKLIFGEVSTGAEQDLKQATRLARKMVLNWGMSEKLGPMAFREGEEQPFLGREIAHPREYSEATAKLIDDEVRNIVVRAETKVAHTLKANRARLTALAQALLEHETLSSTDIEAVLEAAVRTDKAMSG